MKMIFNTFENKANIKLMVNELTNKKGIKCLNERELEEMDLV